MIFSVLVSLLLFLSKGSGSGSVDFIKLTSRGKGLSMAQLNDELFKAIKGEGIPILDACIIATESQAATMDPKDRVKEALHMNWQYVLLCAQSKLLFDWDHPRDYHLFYAQAFGMFWFWEGLWEGIPFNWEIYWREILRADNVKFFQHAREKLSLHYLNADTIPSWEILESYDAAKILCSLGMGVNGERYSVHQLVELGRLNTLRLLHGKDTGIFTGLEASLQTFDPHVLDFVLSIDSNSVNVPWIVKEAIERDLLNVLEILYRHQKKCPLTIKDATYAAELGRLDIIEWTHSVDPKVLPSKDCMLNIMICGHAQVLELLYSLDSTFLPAAYHQNRASRRTLWHHDTIAKLYGIDSKLVPLEPLYRHAIQLDNYKVALWTGSKIYETTEKVVVTQDDINSAIKSKAWLFVLWGAQRDPKLMPKREQLVLKVKDFNFPRMPKTQTELVTLLDGLYTLTGDHQYLPTVDELRNQPIKYVETVCAVKRPHISVEELLMICSFKATGTEIHKWLSVNIYLNIATVEMANMAAWLGNIEALDWILEQNPEVFPSKEYIERGLKLPKSCKKAKLLQWVFDRQPEMLPPEWHLALWGYHDIAPELLYEVKDYQNRQSLFTSFLSSFHEFML